MKFCWISCPCSHLCWEVLKRWHSCRIPMSSPPIRSLWRCFPSWEPRLWTVEIGKKLPHTKWHISSALTPSKPKKTWTEWWSSIPMKSSRSSWRILNALSVVSWRLKGALNVVRLGTARVIVNCANGKNIRQCVHCSQWIRRRTKQKPRALWIVRKTK